MTAGGADEPARAATLDVVREEFGRVAYTHKAHSKMVDHLTSMMLWEKRINAVLVALTTTNVLGIVLSNARWTAFTAALLSTVTLLVTVYGLSRNREHLVDQHRRTALGLWLLREKYVHLIGDLKSMAITPDEARRQRDELTQQTSQVYASAPDTDSKAYAATQQALRRNEEQSFSTKEIDLMLPPALRSDPAS